MRGIPEVTVAVVAATGHRGRDRPLLATTVADAVGIGIESVAALARHPLDAFRASERLAARSTPDAAAILTLLWTAKEATLKADGRGLRCDALDLEIDPNSLAVVEWTRRSIPLDRIHLQQVDMPRGMIGTAALFRPAGEASADRSTAG